MEARGGGERVGERALIVLRRTVCPTAMMEEWGRWTGMVLKGERGWGA